MRFRLSTLMRPVRKPRAVMAALVGGAASLLMGYLVGTLGSQSPTVLSNRLPGLEYFIQPQSFSEVENTKAILEGLAVQCIAEIRIRRGLAFVKAASVGALQAPAESAQLAGAIRELERRMLEFRGTEQELLLAKELLLLLSKRGDDVRWIEVYLSLLYQHPTQEMVGSLAQQALHKAKAVGREDEVWDAFRHVSSIPLDFQGKSRIPAIASR